MNEITVVGKHFICWVALLKHMLQSVVSEAKRICFEQNKTNHSSINCSLFFLLPFSIPFNQILFRLKRAQDLASVAVSVTFATFMNQSITYYASSFTLSSISFVDPPLSSYVLLCYLNAYTCCCNVGN